MEPALSSTSFEFPAVFACRLAGKKCGNFKTDVNKAGSILYTKKKYLYSENSQKLQRSLIKDNLLTTYEMD